MAGRRLLKFPQVVGVQRVALEAANKAAVARADMEGLFADTSLSRIGFLKPGPSMGTCFNNAGALVI